MQIFSLKKYMTVVQTVDMPLMSINESLIVQQTLLVLFLSGVFFISLYLDSNLLLLN